MSEKKNRKVEVIFLICGILFFVLLIVLGYWLAAIVGLVLDDSVDFLTGFCMVANKPFDKYFNDFTPVGMALGFIIAEVLFFFLIVKNRKSNDVLDEDEYAPDIIDIADKAGMDHLTGIKQSTSTDKELFVSKVSTLDLTDTGVSDYVLPGDEVNGTANNKNNVVMEEEKKQEELSFDDAIVTDLLNDYDLSQIAAMLQIKRYIEIDNVVLLRKMFKPYMEADDITSYIEMFYE